MGRRKTKGKRGDDSSEEEAQVAKQQPSDAAATTEQPAQLSRKEKQRLKKQQKESGGGGGKKKKDEDDDDITALLSGKGRFQGDSDEDDSEEEQPSKASAPSKQKNQKKKAPPLPPAVSSDSEEEDSEEEEAIVAPSKKGKKNNKKQPQPKKAVGFAALDSDSDDDDDDSEAEVEIPQPTKKNSKKQVEDEDSEMDEDDEEEDEEVEQVAMVMADDWGASTKSKKSSKKEKKEKKEKKSKKEKKAKKEKKSKKEKKDDDEDEEEDSTTKANDDDDVEEEEVPKVKAEKKKPVSSLHVMEDEPDWVDPNATATAAEEEDAIIYGAPDDKVWTDKSAAEQQEGDGEDDNDAIPLYGQDGKKLSNKERKRLLKAKEAAQRLAEYEKVAAVASRQGAQFACSQTAFSETDRQWENSLDVNIPSFSISAAGKILFQDASLNVAHGRRYGLVAPNGRGKSTLLKMIASRDLQLPPRIDFLYVEQEVMADDTPAVEAVLQADAVRWSLLQEEAELMKAVDAGDESEDKLERLQIVVDELVAMGSDAAEAKARRILYGLGFSMEMQTKPTRMFSGGWRMRISLARALFVEPTLLMLDEPTNHLDLNAVIWLDEYLQKWKKTLLVVSHDQDFLNSVCEEILHIEDLKLCSYKGNYDSFKRAERTKFQQYVKAWEKQEKRIKELKRGGQSKQKAQETVMQTAKKREAGARGQKKKKQAVATGSEAAELVELIKRPKEYTVTISFVEVADLSRPVMQVADAHFRYSPKHPVIFDNIDFGIDMQSRICIVGPNGAGKSTLLKLLTGELAPTSGDIRRNPRLRMGIYNQHFVERLPMSLTPIEHLRNRFPEEDYQSVRNRLGKYGLEGHAHEVTMRDLSGGQKARVVFVELSLQRPHILLLDEPTNNLDIETIDALCIAIKEFNGGIVVVTHDQRLIEECECTLWVVEKRGVTRWDAGFEDYRETILRELEEAVQKENDARQEKLAAAALVKAEKLAKLAKRMKKLKKKEKSSK